jgi:hypothetical protein
VIVNKGPPDLRGRPSPFHHVLRHGGLADIWGRNMFHYEPPSSGPSPVVEKRRRPNGALIANVYVGDYSNPILRPQAAEAVRKRGEMELSGTAPPNAHNQCWLGT